MITHRSEVKKSVRGEEKPVEPQMTATPKARRAAATV
jgi:hypothetical protein